jgi:hypothetical protein
VNAAVLPAPPPLPGPYARPPAADGLRPSPETVALVRGQVRALLMSSPAYHSLPQPERRRLAFHLVKIAAYAAECVRDDWYQSAQLGQRPIVRYKQVVEQPVAQAQASADEFQPAAADQVARVTRETLRAIAFPTFVADLIKGSFNAIVDASIQQMEAYSRLLEDTSKTIDQFMADNISDNQARDWLAQMYPEHLRVNVRGGSPRLGPAPGAADRALPNWRSDLNLPQEVPLDDSSIEEVLVPAARRKLAQSRLQLLSTMVLLGINRIIVTGGKIRATMQFHIDATDRARQERATDFDFRTAAQGSANFGMWSASASMSVSYVSSVRSASDTELNVDANLTGEVEIHFRSDYFPLERFAGSAAIERIQGNTPVPQANAPVGNFPWSDEVQPLPSRRSPRPGPTLRDINTQPGEARIPVAPVPVRPVSPAPVPSGQTSDSPTAPSEANR